MAAIGGRHLASVTRCKTAKAVVKPFMLVGLIIPLAGFLLQASEWKCIFIPERFTVMAQEPLIPTWLYKVVTSMEAAIFNCQCDQMRNCEGGCETVYFNFFQD